MFDSELAEQPKPAGPGGELQAQGFCLSEALHQKDWGRSVLN